MNGEHDHSRLVRFARQMIFPPLGREGQRAMGNATALVVGVGGLGSWVAELLARAGVGRLRLVDDDRVELTNIHRQALYDEADAEAATPKVLAAAERIARINAGVIVETARTRLDRTNISTLAADVDLILDGTDSFATRFLINDFAVKHARPWVFAGVVGAEAQTMTIVPPRTACLRCVLEGPPPPCSDPACRSVGVLGPAVAAVAAIEAAEAMKILSGRGEQASPYLLKLDLWGNTVQRIDVSAAAANADCPCCRHREFEFLEP